MTIRYNENDLNIANGILQLDGSSLVPIEHLPTGLGGTRATYQTVSSFPLTVSAPASDIVKIKYYLSNGASAITVNLPAVASVDGLELVFKLLGTGTVTIDANGAETIDGAATFSLTLQNSSVTMTATSAGWRIE